MFSVSSKFSYPMSSFRGKKEIVYGVKIGNDFLKSDEYIKNIDLGIVKDAKEKGFLSYVFNTCNFGRAQFEDKKLKADRAAYKKIIIKCFEDLDKAIINNESKEVINKLSNVIEIFTKKYGHLA